MKEKRTYIAEDGTEFAGKDECMRYEAAVAEASAAAKYFEQQGLSGRKATEYRRVVLEWCLAREVPAIKAVEVA